MTQMLDLRTIFALGVAGAGLEAITWLLFWLAWRRMDALKYFAGGFAIISAGLCMMMLRGAEPAIWWITVDNVLVKLGLVLIAAGLARFLGQPRRARLMLGLLALVMAGWGAAVATAPGDLYPRLLASAVFTVVMMSLMSLALLRDGSVPRLMRGVTIGVLCFYMIAAIVSVVQGLGLPLRIDGLATLGDRNAWFLMQGNIFLTGLFASLILMVSWRLSADLQANNAALRQEVEERKRLERKLSASLEAEKLLREEQSDFTRFVSHEFRTPLATIRNAAEMIVLTGHGIDPAARERLSAIGQALDRLSSLIDRFLAGDREGAFHPEPLPLSNLMADVMLHFDMTVGGHRLNVDLRERRGFIVADSDMLLTAIINLVDNALKYSPEDSPVTLTVAARGDHVAIRVADRGIGIPEADRALVGRRYFRASNTKPGTGTGMGLYAARRLVAYHDGELVLEPLPEGGTLAEIRLPLPIDALPEDRKATACP
ncbi:sensor histidine kinase [Chachezhania sediminis]|uniref:sensor histidine kinase n=1 Tax=Chachezhania sediminis TaxID=2599291 RepID=UPI00131A816D|nr:HAMP domain-containing sensor histidine kinase [Chachezhania sediminis]